MAISPRLATRTLANKAAPSVSGRTPGAAGIPSTHPLTHDDARCSAFRAAGVVPWSRGGSALREPARPGRRLGPVAAGVVDVGVAPGLVEGDGGGLVLDPARL